MAIQVITNFNINAPVPIDERNVVSDITARNNIEFKFPGLRTFVLSEGISYVYGTDSVWRVDGGIPNNNNNTGGNGIYGGSGSLPSDVSINFGTISNSSENRSNFLYYDTSGQTDGDKSYLYNYGYRRNTGQDWDTMGYRTEQKIVPFGSSVRQGPFIEYSGSNPRNPLLTSVLNFGSGNVNLTGRTVRMSIHPKIIEFYSSQTPSNEFPLSIHSIKDDTVLGYNSTPEELDSYSYRQSSASYRMLFSINKLDFDTRIPNSSTINTLIRFETTSEPTNVSSNVKILVDQSSRDWDNTTTRDPKLLTPQEIVRQLEHRYTRTQMWQSGTFQEIKSEVLYLNTDGNSYEVTLQKDAAISNIKAYKSNTLQPDFPTGTILTIKFINSDLTSPGFLRIADGAKGSTSRIKSDLTDATFDKNDSSRLTINHGTSLPDNGEIITFRKFNKGTQQWWEIVNLNRERRIVSRNWSLPTTDWNFIQVSWLSATSSSSSKFNRFAGSSITSPFTSVGNPPNKWGPDLTSNTTNRETINSDGFKFRISVDGNRIVYVQGNFKIDIKDTTRNTTFGNNTRKFYFRSVDQRTNIWNIGKITSVSILPQWESAWTPVRTFARGVYTGPKLRIEIIDPILSINRLGDIFLSFDAEASFDSNIEVFMQDIDFEVYVPPFTYTAATGSIPIGGDGGGGGGVNIG